MGLNGRTKEMEVGHFQSFPELRIASHNLGLWIDISLLVSVSQEKLSLHSPLSSFLLLIFLMQPKVISILFIMQI